MNAPIHDYLPSGKGCDRRAARGRSMNVPSWTCLPKPTEAAELRLSKEQIRGVPGATVAIVQQST